MHPLIQQLIAEGPVLTDGAWGTELQRHGLPAGGCADEWNLSHSEHVEQVARDYVQAGSRLILTNTFRANRFALTRVSLADRLVEINRAGVSISRRAAGGKAAVFASIGPSGKLLLAEEVTEEQLHDAFTEQAEALADAGAEGLVLETYSDLTEALIALKAVRSTGLPVVVSMVFDSGRESERTMMGNTPEQVAKALTEEGADVVGANCGSGAAGYAQVCRRMHEATDLPIWTKPNAGLPEIVEGRITYRTLPEDFAAQAARLSELGALFIGGCCGTEPRFIRALGECLRNRSRN